MTLTQRALAAAIVASVALAGALHAHSANPRNASSHQLREVVTHRVCYVDVNDNRVCE